MASKNEEKNLADLKETRICLDWQIVINSTSVKQAQTVNRSCQQSVPWELYGQYILIKHQGISQSLRIYCGKPGHQMQDCQHRRKDMGESESHRPTL